MIEGFVEQHWIEILFCDLLRNLEFFIEFS